MADFIAMRADGTCEPRSIATGVIRLTISPVGDGPLAVNNKNDVRTIQELLNRVEPLRGGPDPKLAEDSICGPKTKAAIRKFQNFHLGWNDGRVDPDGPTEKALLKEVKTVPSRQIQRAFSKIPEVTGVVTAARANLMLSRLHFSNSLPGGIISSGRSAAAKVLDKHFHLDRHPDPVAAIDHIDGIFFNMHTAIGYLPQGLVLFDDDPPTTHSDGFAYSYGGGYHFPHRFAAGETGQMQVYAGTIYLCKRLEKMDEEGIAYIVTHELAHYVGPLQGKPDWIRDIPGRGYNHRPGYSTLTAQEALINADSYSQFAFEAAGRPFVHRRHEL